jgi:hypothetical protein
MSDNAVERTAVAMETRPPKDFTHIAIAAVLFCFAAMAYALGAEYVAGLFALGLVIEIAAWVFLRLRGPSTYSKIERPHEGGQNEWKGKRDA